MDADNGAGTDVADGRGWAGIRQFCVNGEVGRLGRWGWVGISVGFVYGGGW